MTAHQHGPLPAHQHAPPPARLRPAEPGDHAAIVAAVRTWWTDRSPAEMRELSLLLPKLFLQFFARTSLVREDADGVRAFLVGFHPADHPDEAYIHFVGVDPALRGQGVGRELYETFFRDAAAAGRTRVRSVTSPTNTRSIAFHRALGFRLQDGDGVGPDGVPVHKDYDGPGLDRVCFLRTLTVTDD
ncbi:GNAT family N-acetyltransferase [Streptomyces sp. MNP-20]|uniref:GNAT family N-acetyltransferase n=1 Tax=Streptomyces sp. MNP-20 TaxID=2721165 RepID=UPI0015555E5A|nr:GNAT family N-acetyltransferase [Streptomyces sp. MNP-20]